MFGTEELRGVVSHAKQAPGWRNEVSADGSVETITPTGHHYQSRAPDPPHHRHRDIKIDIRWPIAA
jgi:hypothetical protein